MLKASSSKTRELKKSRKVQKQDTDSEEELSVVNTSDKDNDLGKD